MRGWEWVVSVFLLLSWAGVYVEGWGRSLTSLRRDYRRYESRSREIRCRSGLTDVEASENGVKKVNEWSFFDEARVFVRGGDGGDGCMAMRREYAVEFGGPAGGNGGDGGSVYVEARHSLNTLSRLRRRRHVIAKSGTNGQGHHRHGHNEEDSTIYVPCGTEVFDDLGKYAGGVWKDKDRLLVAKGGRGGRGNASFRTPRMNAPEFAELGEKGDSRWIRLVMKLIADVGIIGVPNAGKSTLLSVVSNAKPKIADYPFTTLIPNLGVCDVSDFHSKSEEDHHPIEESSHQESLVLADIPGLLEGAHTGVGLGINFLRHIQRCRVLIHVISGASPDPVGDLLAVNTELKLFSPTLLEKPQIVVLNKCDLPEVVANVSDTLASLRKAAGHSRVVGISAVTARGTTALMRKVASMISVLPKPDPQTETEEVLRETPRVRFDVDEEAEKGHYSIQVIPSSNPDVKQFRVTGRMLEKLVERTNWRYYEAMQRFQRIVEALGVHDSLTSAGAQPGDTVWIGELEFSFWDRRHKWVRDLGLENMNARLLSAEEMESRLHSIPPNESVDNISEHYEWEEEEEEGESSAS